MALEHNGTNFELDGMIFEHDGTTVEHDGTILGCDCLSFDLTFKDPVEGQVIKPKGCAIMFKGRTVMLRGFKLEWEFIEALCVFDPSLLAAETSLSSSQKGPRLSVRTCRH